MKTFIATIKNKGMTWNSPAHRAMFVDFLSLNEGKKLRIELAKNPVTDEMRGYYFGAVLPVFRSTCDKWANLSTDELHEIAKKQFNFFEAWNPKAERIERFGQAIMSESSNTKKAMEFLQKVAGYLTECGLAMPDPEEYNKFINSAPMK